jgi:hypothetical protein
LFYPYEAPSEKGKVTDEIENEVESGKGIILPRLCAMCGCKATNVCSKCKAISYCSREHQTKHWREHKLQCSGISTSASIPKSEADAVLVKSLESDQNSPIRLPTKQTLVFPEFDLSISSEILEDLKKVDALNKSVLEARYPYFNLAKPRAF